MAAKNSTLLFRTFRPIFESDSTYPGSRSRSIFNNIPPERSLKFSKTDSILIPCDSTGFRLQVGYNENTGHVGNPDLDKLIATGETKLLRVHGEFQETHPGLKGQTRSQNLYFQYNPNDNATPKFDPSSTGWHYPYGDPFFIGGEIATREGGYVINIWNLRTGELFTVPVEKTRLLPTYRYQSPLGDQESRRKSKENSGKLFKTGDPLVIVTALGRRNIRQHAGSRTSIYCINVRTWKAGWILDSLVVAMTQQEIVIYDSRDTPTTTAYSAQLRMPNLNLEDLAEHYAPNSQPNFRRNLRGNSFSSESSRSIQRVSRSRRLSETEYLEEDAPGESDNDYDDYLARSLSPMSLLSEELEDLTGQSRNSTPVDLDRQRGTRSTTGYRRRVNIHHVTSPAGETLTRYQGSPHGNSDHGTPNSEVSSHRRRRADRNRQSVDSTPQEPSIDDNIAMPSQISYQGLYFNQMQSEEAIANGLRRIARGRTSSPRPRARNEEERNNISEVDSGLESKDEDTDSDYNHSNYSRSSQHSSGRPESQNYPEQYGPSGFQSQYYQFR